MTARPTDTTRPVAAPVAVPAAPSAIAVLADAGMRLLIDSEALQQAVYLYRPIFDESDRIVDLEIVMLNEAAKRVPLAGHIVAGLRVSEVFIDLHEALDAANDAWNGGRPSGYRIERRGFHEGRPLVVRYDIATMRAGGYIVQVSADRTVLEQLATADTRFRLMAEASVDGLMLLEPEPDGDGYVVAYANPRALIAEPGLRVGERLPLDILEVALDAVQELQAASSVRRYLQREVLARRVSIEATFIEVGDGQVMMTVRELTSREAARAELERSDRVLRAIGAGAFGTIAVYEPRFNGHELVEMSLLWSASGHGHGAGARPPLDATAVLSAAELLRMARSMLESDTTKRSGWVPVQTDEGEERSVEFTLVLSGDRFVLEFVERTEELAARTALAMVTATADAQRNFLSRVSHELRSPLNVIHGYSQLLGRLHLPEPATGHVAHIERGVTRMVQIVDDLLLLGQLDQGLLRIDEQEIDVRGLVDGVIVAAQQEPWWRNGALTAGQPAESGDATVVTDRSRFVLTAVLLAEASVPLAGRSGIEVVPFERGMRAGVQFVADADSPVAGELWEPFVSSHTIPGAGLGLAVARSMAKALDMVVEVRTLVDEPGRVRLVLSLSRGPL
jgi:signal transduction histidine kinase